MKEEEAELDYVTKAMHTVEAWQQQENGRYPSRLKTIQALSEIEHPGWLAYNLMPATGLGQLVGPSSSGKTFVALDLALCVVRGVPSWLGYDLDTHGDVVYCLLEGSFDVVDRVRAWELYEPHATYPEPDGRKLYVLPEQDLDLADDKSLDLLSNDIVATLGVTTRQHGVIETQKHPALIVVDTQALATPGTEENSPKEMGAIMARMKRFGTDWQTVVLLVHHTAKSGDGGARGTGAQYAAVDFTFQMTKSKLWQAKNKYATLMPTHPLKLVSTPVGRYDDRGREKSSCWVEYGDPKQTSDLSERIRALDLGDRDDDAELARKTLGDRPLAENTIRDRLFGGHTSLKSQTRFNRLVTAGVIRSVGNHHYVLVRQSG